MVALSHSSAPLCWSSHSNPAPVLTLPLTRLASRWPQPPCCQIDCTLLGPAFGQCSHRPTFSLKHALLLAPDSSLACLPPSSGHPCSVCVSFLLSAQLPVREPPQAQSPSLFSSLSWKSAWGTWYWVLSTPRSKRTPRLLRFQGGRQSPPLSGRSRESAPSGLDTQQSSCVSPLSGHHS